MGVFELLTPFLISINIIMEKTVKKFEITVNSDSIVSLQLITEFIQNFNNIKNENTKIRIMLLVKDFIRLQKAK